MSSTDFVRTSNALIGKQTFSNIIVQNTTTEVYLNFVSKRLVLWTDYEYFLSMFGIYYSQISSDELPMCHQTLAETDKVCMQSTMKAYRWEVWTSCWIKLTIQSLTEWEQFQEEEMRIEASSGQNGRNWEALWWLKKWDRRQCKDWKKKTLAYEGDVPSMNELCVIFL